MEYIGDIWNQKHWVDYITLSRLGMLGTCMWKLEHDLLCWHTYMCSQWRQLSSGVYRRHMEPEALGRLHNLIQVRYVRYMYVEVRT